MVVFPVVVMVVFMAVLLVTADAGHPTLRPAWTTRTPRKVLGRQLAKQFQKQGSEGN
jgi:hypothetical protein